MINLTAFEKGDCVRVVSLGCGQELKKRLADLGIFAGAEVKVCKNDNHGPLLVGVFNSKIVLDREGAKKIYGEKI
ncbi:MAG: ferrous iron transport protein A [Candidatus Pacebacteria bacterium]|nr:ferrous iron transport protein A [Candidatus Paceibacterota bacterium]